MKRSWSTWFAGVAALSAAALVACGGDDSSGGTTPGGSSGRTCTTVEPTLASLNANIFSSTKSCGGTNCHGVNRDALNTLHLEGQSDADVLKELTAQTDRGDGSMRIVPGDPSKSFLLAKVKGDFTGFPCKAVADPKAVGYCGDRMPGPPNPALCANEIAAIEKWIAAGAMP